MIRFRTCRCRVITIIYIYVTFHQLYNSISSRQLSKSINVPSEEAIHTFWHPLFRSILTAKLYVRVLPSMFLLFIVGGYGDIDVTSDNELKMKEKVRKKEELHPVDEEFPLVENKRELFIRQLCLNLETFNMEVKTFSKIPRQNFYKQILVIKLFLGPIASWMCYNYLPIHIVWCFFLCFFVHMFIFYFKWKKKALRKDSFLVNSYLY